jgi:hypothetical protein
MVPVGYMAKRIVKPPGWIAPPQIIDVYSVGNCVNDDFADYIPHWKHNVFWFFDSPEGIRNLAIQIPVSLDGCALFYYEAHEMQFDGTNWGTYTLDPAASIGVLPPASNHLEGFDVVTFYAGTSPECSPLSCNALAAEIPTNTHCLFDSFEDAEAKLESGAFREGEPGPYRIYSVYTVEWPQAALL